MKKAIVIILILIAVALLVYFVFIRKGVAPPPEGGRLPPPVIPPPPATSTLPVGDRIAIGTPEGSVMVRNFYREAAERDADSVLIRGSDDYELTYFIGDSSFSITVLGQPFERAREIAEKEFLAALGISQAEACKLTVTLMVPYSYNPDLAGIDFGLSFCGGGSR